MEMQITIIHLLCSDAAGGGGGGSIEWSSPYHGLFYAERKTIGDSLAQEMPKWHLALGALGY